MNGLNGQLISIVDRSGPEPLPISLIWLEFDGQILRIFFAGLNKFTDQLNKSAYSIRKFAQTTSGSFFMTNSADFHLDVSTNPEQIQSIYDSFALVDSFFINDNFIGLYSSSKSNANRKLEKSIKPDWTKNPPIVVKNGKARSATSSTSATLQGAYESAVQYARKQILGYYFTSVSSYIENVDDSLLNELAVESSFKLVSTPITRCYVEPLFNDGMYSYLVYIEMETEQYK